VTYLHAENLSLVSVKWMTKFFVTGDVISFLMQCSGKIEEMLPINLSRHID
jgi:hypothetical protein